MRLSAIGFGIVLFGTLTGTASAAPSPNTIVVAISGYGGCLGTTTPEQSYIAGKASELSAAMVAEMPAEPAPKLVHACFGILNTTVNYQSDDRAGSPDGYVSTAAFIESIRAYATEGLPLGESRTVHLVGHSYGGWLAMHASQILADKKVRLGTLATIDPISAALCTPFQFTASLLRQTPLRACTESPRDLDNHAVAKAVRSWSHFYQNEFPILHSAPITAAQTSERVNVGREAALGHSGGAHQAIALQGPVWSAIRSAVSASGK